jgi:hypothetical protein
MARIEVVLEAGKKRTIASALDWPGWARVGNSREEALEALVTYGPRYRAVVGRRRLGFEVPDDVSAFEVVEEIEGNATTDFGVPWIAAKAEAEPVDADDLKRLMTVLDASWDALARAVEAAEGKELRKGPRGGGRSTEKIVEHVLGAHHQGYLRQIYYREALPETKGLDDTLKAMKKADAAALAFAASGEMPEKGPRGGALWTPRYFVRRAAWHILDHAWEIEDRIEP